MRYEIELKEENKTRLNKALSEVANSALSGAKRRYEDALSSISYYINGLAQEYEKKAKYSAELERASKEQLDIAEKLMSISRLDKVESATCFVDEDNGTKNIVVKTKDLYFRTLNGGRYYLGKATINFKMGTMQIKFDSNNRRKSYWGEDCPHPHVNHNGEACLGNTGELIASLQSNNEFGLIFEVLIAFLEQANTEDGAGAYAMNWDKVDEEGNVIQEGYRNKHRRNFHYGATPDEDTYGEVKYCAHCGDAIDGNSYDIGDGEYVCEDCYDEHYVTCNECGKIEYRDDAVFVGDAYVCQDCADTKYTYCEHCDEYAKKEYVHYYEELDKNICDDCIANYYEQCSQCGDFVPKGELTATETNKSVCENCLEEYYTKCENCNGYFLAEETYEHDGKYYCIECYEGLFGHAPEDEEISPEEEVAVGDETPRADDEEALHELYNQDIRDAEETEEEPQEETQEEMRKDILLSNALRGARLFLEQPVVQDATLFTQCDVCGKGISTEEAVICGVNTYCVSCAVTTL